MTKGTDWGRPWPARYARGHGCPPLGTAWVGPPTSLGAPPSPRGPPPSGPGEPRLTTVPTPSREVPPWEPSGPPGEAPQGPPPPGPWPRA